MRKLDVNVMNNIIKNVNSNNNSNNDYIEFMKKIYDLNRNINFIQLMNEHCFNMFRSMPSKSMIEILNTFYYEYEFIFYSLDDYCDYITEKFDIDSDALKRLFANFTYSHIKYDDNKDHVSILRTRPLDIYVVSRDDIEKDLYNAIYDEEFGLDVIKSSYEKMNMDKPELGFYSDELITFYIEHYNELHKVWNEYCKEVPEDED